MELLGYSFHRTVMHMQADAERMNRLVLLGYQVYQFTYPQVVEDPGDVVATVAAALRRVAAA